MARCPVCGSARIVIVIDPRRRAFCPGCGARWVQDGGEQRSIERPEVEAQRGAASPPA